MARKKKAEAKADVKFIVTEDNNRWNDENARVFDTLKEAEEYYQEGLDNDDFDEDFVNDVEIMEVKIVKVHHLYAEKRYEVGATSRD